MVETLGHSPTPEASAPVESDAPATDAPDLSEAISLKDDLAARRAAAFPDITKPLPPLVLPENPTSPVAEPSSLQRQREEEASWRDFSAPTNAPRPRTAEEETTYRREIEAAYQEREQLKELMTDQLTGLPNRLAFVNWLEQELGQQPEQLAVGFLDMDHLKELNDTQGHEAADAVIQQLAEVLEEATLAYPEAIAARRSGDEFYLAINGLPPEQMQALAEQLMVEIRKLGVTASLGMIQASKDASVEEVMTAADAAMYQAKEAGRNQFKLATMADLVH